MRIGVVLAIGLSASLARADLAQDQARLRLAAEQHEKDAHLAKSDELYLKCAQAYLDLFNLAPDTPGGDEQLYNAGVCFHEGHSDGAAIPVWQRLEQKYPSSKLRSRVVARLALTYDDAALWSKAAETWERYASMFAGEKDAREALSQAIAIRKATGEDELLLKDSKYFLKAFGAKDPKTAAQAMYGMTEAYRRKGPAALELHLRDFLRQYARAELELRVRAMLELAESIWKRSCAMPGTDGLCLKLERSRVLPVAVKPPKPTPAAKRCGSASSTTLVVVPRDPRLASEANKLLVDTEKLAASAPSPQTNYFQARARLLLADQKLEAYVAVRFPTGLDFSLEQKRVRETSLKRFNDFISTRTKLGVDARTAYEAILTFKDPTAAIAASQRLAFVPQAMATDLLAAELPKDVRSGGDAKDKVEAFCDAMLPIAEPLFTQAIAGYEVCLAKASQLGIRNASTRACAREAAALAPTRFPLSTELLPEAPLALPVFDESPVRKSPSLPIPFREDVERFWKVYGATPIPNGLCLPLAAKFAALGKLNKSADAWFMSGLTYGRCQREENGKAKAAYEAALALDPKHGKSMSNLGELAIRAGQPYVAKAQWEAAVLVNPKLFSANLGLATVALREYRTANAPARAKLRGEIELRARSAAALDPDNALPFVQLGILALLDGKPALAKYLAYRAEKYDPTPHVQLLHAALANGETEALPRLEAAQTNTWQIPEIALALGIQQLALARYDDAAKTLARAAPSYEVLIARGVAARGLGKLADAEARYTEASKLNPARVEAHFNLGVLFKDHIAARATDPAAAKTAFKKAADAFRRANTPEAKLWADDCDKAAAQR